MDDPERILLVGDLHMNTLAAFQAIDHARALQADLILQLGDFGFWPRGADNAGQKFLRKVDARLAAAGLMMWFVPGNHEDWHALAKRPVGVDGLRVISPQIREIPIGHRWTWGATRWLAVGGAPSVDKPLRVEGVSWFPEEEVTEAQAAAIIDAGLADVVVAHDAPMGVPLLARKYEQHLPPWNRTRWWPVSAMVAADAHQERMGSILHGVRPGFWFHGHHHVRHSSGLDAPHGEVRVEGLALDGTPMDERTLLVDFNGNRVLWQEGDHGGNPS